MCVNHPVNRLTMWYMLNPTPAWQQESGGGRKREEAVACLWFHFSLIEA